MTRRTGAYLAAALLLVGAFLIWSRRTPPAPPAARAPRARSAEARPVTAAPPAPTSSAKARQVRDEMREQILQALRKRDAGVSLPSPRAPDAPRPEQAPPAEEARGHYEPSYIREHFREDMFPLLRQCYASALLQQPALGGRLVLSFSIVGDPSVGGIVEDADFAEESDLKNDEMRTCVRESLMTLTFDKPPTGGGYVTVKYPVVFSPDDDPGDAGDGADAGAR